MKTSIFQKNKTLTVPDICLIGAIICIGLAEISHLASGYFGWSFSACADLFKMLFVIFDGFGLLLGLLCFLLWKKDARKAEPVKKTRKGITSVEYLLGLLLFALFSICIARLMTAGDFSLYKDLTPELTASFLETDQIFSVNPTTGTSYQTPVPSRFKLLCLPTLYGVLCRIFQADASVLCFKIMPIVVFFLACMAFYTVSRALWGENRQNRMLFCVLILVLFLVSDSGEGMVGFQLFHQGYSPQTIRIAVLLPYTVSLLIRRKYFWVWLPVLAETCLVWTGFGVGWCFLSVVLWAVANMAVKAHMTQKGGEV